MQAETILVVDDERGILLALKGILEDEGYRPVLVEDGESALRRLREQPVDLVLLDIWLPGRDGVAILQEITKGWPDIPVVMMSGHGTIETAVRTTKLGAYDFIEKPLSLEKTLLVLRHALEERRLTRENSELLRQAESSVEIIGEDPVIVELRRRAALAAAGSGRVLVTGEHGTGKELVARSIHVHSPRRLRPFIEVNCAALPGELVESELFGHERGAFTGAVDLRRGKFEQADGGTLFFDEIGDMTPRTQGTLLRVLESQSFERVGGSKPVHVDVRVIAATNRRLEDLIAAGLFREDLFYRLAVISLHVPPLRERPGDVQILAGHFLSGFCTHAALQPKQFTPEALAALTAHPWPGNVRELRNCVERLVMMVPGESIGADDLDLAPRPAGAASRPRLPDPAPSPSRLQATQELPPDNSRQ
jgi:two-component system nitrogen regulation response regulator NtrX